MPEQLTIIKNVARPKTQDYDKLRQLGISYIEQFSKELWTDYNVHDPGITTLEILSYAITDLAYRTSMPMEDILARLKSDTTKDFFTAREILPCNPVTFDDLRKKIIDIKGVENAWVLPYTDPVCAETIDHPAFYIQCKINPKRIDLRPTPADGFEPRNLKGLYEFNLLLEEDPVLGDLNIMNVDWEMRDGSGARTALVRFIFPVNIQKTYPVPNTLTDIDKLVTGTITNIIIAPADFNAFTNTFNITIVLTTGNVTINNVAYHIRPLSGTVTLSTLETQLGTKMTSVALADKQEIIAKILSIFQKKVQKVNGIIDEVYCMYERVRNLCEDVFRIGIVPSQEIALCADIETDTGADLEEILGRIYFEIDTFFSPPVRFYLLKELMEKGYPTDIIFEGPLLRHGFLIDEELRKSSLFKEVHVSDLYNIIMSIPGVKTVKYLQITNYLNGLWQTEGESWYLDLLGEYHLNLDRLRSKIIFYKGNLPIIADKQVAERIYQDLKSTLSRPRINTSLKVINDILPPVGTPYKLDEFYSIQNDFPMVFGVNRDGIPAEAAIVHKSKIKQLKGYLLFFDQVLANYLAQLAQLKNLYAVSNASNTTYFSQPVYDIDISDTENLNFHDTAPLLKDFAMPPAINIDDFDAYKAPWSVFIANAANGYRTKLDSYTEPADEHLDRRNRFLDHLLARFAENFSDYAVMMYKFTGNLLESADKKTAEQIADDKKNFLQEYHILSYNRGKGQYYKCCPSGDCEVPGVVPVPPAPDDVLQYDWYSVPKPSNPTGLHKRASLMLGMSIHDNAWMVLDKFVVNGPIGGPFTFSIHYDGVHTLDSTGNYPTRKKAFEAMEKIVTLLALEDANKNDWVYFQILPSGFGQRFEVREDILSLPFAVSQPVYPDVPSAKLGYNKLKQALLDEGMHIVDHLLLRPLPVLDLNIPMPDDPPNPLPDNPVDMDYGFFPLCGSLNTDCDCPINDYYSFRISVVLPYWTQRFRNMDFRGFAEDTIHRETPAHILPKFCWVSMWDMWRLETAYKAWFAENKKYKPNMNLLKGLLLSLIKVLNTLTNVYPEGHLHDCDNPSTDNPVILNQTILGTF